MILQFHFSADRERLKVDVPAIELSEEHPALIAINMRSKRIVAIGETGEEMEAKAPKYWARYGKDITFVHPFDLGVDEPLLRDNGPLMAARVIQWHATMAIHRWRGTSTLRVVFGPFVDGVDYHLELPHIGRLDETQRKKFIKTVRRNLTSVHVMYINGQKVFGR